MPKSTQILKSVCKTINLAKPQVYQVPRKPPLNSLVFEKLPEPRCGDRIAITGPPSPKPVRVCTKEELQAMYCCPTPCDCKIKCKMTTAQKIVKALLLVAKSMIVGALVYYTWAEGLWSDSEHSAAIAFAGKIFLVSEMIKYTWREGLWSDAFHSSCFLQKFVERCPVEEEPTINEFVEQSSVYLPSPEPCLPYIPRSDFILYMLTYIWNKVVIYAFWFVLDAPFEFWEFLLELFRTKPVCKVIDPCDQIKDRAG